MRNRFPLVEDQRLSVQAREARTFARAELVKRRWSDVEPLTEYRIVGAREPLPTVNKGTP